MPSLDLAAIARRAVQRALADAGLSPATGARPAGVHVDTSVAPRPGQPEPSVELAVSPAARRAVRIVTAECLVGTPDGGAFDVPIGARVTPLAQEEAWRRGISLSRGVGSRPDAGGALRVAVGSDHGGYRMKTAVLGWVRELGHRVFDLGCPDESAVDYPDYAAKVARAVAGGDADVGICVDGAGIGSTMAANKVSGVRAANCWNVASANNAREHNYANVLGLPGRMLSDGEAIEVVRTFLSTPYGAERHGKRVAKIMALEPDSQRS